MDTNEQFLLRLRHNTVPDKLLRMLTDKQFKVTETEVETVGGAKSWVPNIKWFAKWFDNVSVISNNGQMRATYVNPIPGAPQSVGVDVNVHHVAVQPQTSDSLADFVADNQPKFNGPAVDPMTWPQMPPVPESMGNVFRKPGWYNTMESMVKIGKHISLAGAPGTGKDTAIMELAAQQGKALVTVGGDGGLRKRDLVGTTEIVNGSTTFKVAEFAAAVVYGWWASITEINAADPDVLLLINACMAQPFVININGKAYPVHPDFRLFVSYNPGLVGTKPLPQSFKDRFFSIQVPFYNRATLRSVLEAHGMPDELVAFWSTKVVEYGIAMWSAYERGQMRYQITARRLMDAVTLMNEKVCDDIKDALTQAVLAAIDSPAEYKAAKNVLDMTV